MRCYFSEWNAENVNNEIKYELITHEHMNFDKALLNNFKIHGIAHQLAVAFVKVVL